MSGIGIIANPYSKSNLRNPERPQLLSYIVGQKGFIEVTDSIEDLSRAAKFFLECGVEYLAINGGDGTICHTITAFINVYQTTPLPKILLLGGGTMNVLMRNLGLKGSPERILAQVVEIVSVGGTISTKRLPTVIVNGRHGFLYADGTSNNILEEFYKSKSGIWGGIWLAIRSITAGLFRTALFRRTIKTREVTFHPKPYVAYSHHTLGTFASTLAFLPLNIPMFGRNLRNDGLFRATTIILKPEKLLFRLPFIAFFSRQGFFWGKHNFDTKELEITGKEPFRYTLDGEIYESINNSVQITIGNTIEFVVP